MALSTDNKLENVEVSASDLWELPNITKFKIAICQLIVTPDKKLNIDHALSLIKFAAGRGAMLVVLPEMWNCPYSTYYFAQHAEDFDNGDSSPSFSMLSEAAVCHRITIIGGSMPEWSNGRLYNTCCIFGPDGKLKARHRKIHLFDIDIPGEISFMESDTFTAGDEPTIVDTDIGRIGIGICHDIRFPELAMLYREKGVHLICYPGAFNISTGELLWELEQRARAVDNQSGEIIATSGHEETVVFAEIDYSKIQLQRKCIPISRQNRGDVYHFVNKHERK